MLHCGLYILPETGPATYAASALCAVEKIEVAAFVVDTVCQVTVSQVYVNREAKTIQAECEYDVSVIAATHAFAQTFSRSTEVRSLLRLSFFAPKTSPLCPPDGGAW